MILTVTLNPAVDRSYRIDGFIAGERFRIFDTTETIGGKGINVAKILHHMNYKVFTTGFYGGFNGKYIMSYLDQIELPNRFIEINSESRNFSVINDLKNNKETILNEAGPRVSIEEQKLFLDSFESMLNEFNFEWIVIAGSVPQNMPESIYYDLVTIGNKHNLKIIVDAKPPFLKKALKAKPYLIKPNRQEYMNLINMREWDMKQAISIGKDIAKEYNTKILLSLGEEGSIFIDQDDTIKIEFIPIEIKNTIGSGDSLVAGYISGIIDGLDKESCLKRGTAYSLSNALKKGIGEIELDEVKELEKLVKIIKL